MTHIFRLICTYRTALVNLLSKSFYIIIIIIIIIIILCFYVLEIAF